MKSYLPLKTWGGEINGVTSLKTSLEVFNFHSFGKTIEGSISVYQYERDLTKIIMENSARFFFAYGS